MFDPLSGGPGGAGGEPGAEYTYLCTLQAIAQGPATVFDHLSAERGEPPVWASCMRGVRESCVRPRACRPAECLAAALHGMK